MRQTPVVSGVALLSLALGIGANVAIFSLVNALLLKALPVAEPQRLVVMGTPNIRTSGPPNTSFTYPQWEYIRDHQDTFAAVFANGNTRFNLQAGGESRPAIGMYVNGRYFDALGVRPIIGRTFSIEDDRRGGGPDGPVSVISYPFWPREYLPDRPAPPDLPDLLSRLVLSGDVDFLLSEIGERLIGRFLFLERVLET